MVVKISDAAANLKRRARARHEAGAKRRHRFLQILPDATRVLLEEFCAEEVYLFGSLARDEATESSDIDLAVRALPRERYFEALAAMMELFCAPVDLVRLEEAPDSLRERVDAEGIRQA